MPEAFHSKRRVVLATDLVADEADMLSTKAEETICFICSHPLLTMPKVC
jgi:hypothetical protein